MKTKQCNFRNFDFVPTGLRPVTTMLLLILVFALGPAPSALGQVPQGFNYQAIVRDDGTNQPIVSQPVIIRITIEDGIGTDLYQETHSLSTDEFGIVSIIIGQGTPWGTSDFNEIDWNNEPLQLKTEVQYPVGGSYTVMGTAPLMSVPYAMVADSLGGPLKNLKVKGSATTPDTEALFEVKNTSGQTVFAVYNEGVRIYVNDIDAKGAKGGFAIGGFGTTNKTIPHEYLFISGDSVRVYIDNGDADKGPKGGFAIGGFGAVKGLNQKYLTVSNDSVRIYVDNLDVDKGVKGGFAIGGYGTAKGKPQDLLVVNNDSVRIYIDNQAVDKGVKGGFAIGGYGTSKTLPQKLLTVSNDSIRMYIDQDLTSKGVKGGFAIGGFDVSKGLGGNRNFLNIDVDTTGVINPSQPRLLWYPLKNAFLTGQVLILKKDSVGVNSMATGFESRAVGDQSQAMGYKAIARGNYSTAIGKNAFAGKHNSFAFGDGVSALRIYSYAFGKGSIARGDYAFALGNIATASGLNSFALGENVTASSSYTYAFGKGSSASNSNAVAMGNTAMASGLSSYAFGDGADANKQYSYAFGKTAHAYGDYSFALGNTATASGANSFALGESVTAGYSYSYAFGKGSSTGNSYAVAMGNGSTATGFSSYSFGESSQATKQYSYAFGKGAHAYGDYSFALGNTATASGNNSFAIGESVTATFPNSYALGKNTNATKDNAIAMGYGANASGLNSFAINGMASGDNSKAFGGSATKLYAFSAGNANTKAEGEYSIAMGENVQATGNNSVSIGSGIFTLPNKATGNWAIAIGSQNEASGANGIAIGAGVHATGAAAIGMGLSVTAQAFNSFVIGFDNEISGTPGSWVETEPLFVVGNGSYGGRPSHNALTILKNGMVGIGTSTPYYALVVTSSFSGGYASQFMNSGNSTTSHGIQVLGGSSTSGGANFISFGRNDGKGGLYTEIGSITQVSTTGVAYNTTSDARIKTNIEDTHLGLAELMKVKVRDFEFKNDYYKQQKTGFIAQELYEVYPEAVTKPGDTKDLWQVDYGRVTPLIIKAVQDQQEEIESLKDTISKLEALVEKLMEK